MVSDSSEDGAGINHSRTILGGNSYLDESITPMMTPMKIEQ